MLTYDTGEQTMSIYKALAQAKAKIKSPKKENKNPFYNSKYADLETIKEAVDPALTEFGLMIVSRVTPISVITSLVHIESEQAIDSEFPFAPNLDAQKRGSEITYGRRYSIQALLDLVAEDDDGNQAAGKTQPDKPAKFDPFQKHREAMAWIPKIKNLPNLREGWLTFQTYKESFEKAGKINLYNEVGEAFKKKETELGGTGE